MKNILKQNEGFTLVELIVAMAMAVIVTAAATSVLLMGMRVNRQSLDTASQQITVSTLLSTVEKIISEGNVSDIEMRTDAWCIRNKENKALLSYSYTEENKGTVYVGDYSDTDPENTATPILTGLLSSYVEMYDGLFTIHVETKEGIFSSSVLCRSMATGAGEYDEDEIDPGELEKNRKAFIEILRSQYRSRGEIKGTDTYYSQWYVGGIYSNGWNAKTPWCACYISWALNKMGAEIKQPESRKATDHLGNPYYKWFANVDEFILYFRSNQYGDNGQSWIERGGEGVQPGDLIFFDWNKGENPQHVGVVLKVENHMVYTIEGNSAGRVTVRSYSENDPRIIGYGVLFG